MTRLRPGTGVAITEDADTVYAAYLPGGPIVVLDGIAALIWAEACGGERETIIERVAEATDAAPEVIRADVDAFVADLMARGLLQ
ncbi:PqqD family protein [Agromyces sp. NPDC056523]|uniref:PqqD family protein n=1 Tax=Agromyces sp. NPDC056523 TaxID=3345850 RepID=UPI0036703B5D